MKKHLHICLLLILFCTVTTKQLRAQGCVAVRQMGGINPLSTNGYTLSKGEFQIGTNYRYFHSFRHYVGTEEQPQRQTSGGGFDSEGNEKGNAVNIYSHAVDLNISYGLTDRLQLNLFIPYVNNERSQVYSAQKDASGTTLVGVRYSMWASGLADIRLTANYLVFSHEKAKNGNLLVGMGLKLNTGSWKARDNAMTGYDLTTNTPSYTMQYVDQAIQPGDGGIGVSIEVQGFKRLHKGIFGFANGYYLFNPKESNGTYKSDPTVVKDPNDKTKVLGTLYGYNVYACPDQFFVRAGVMASVLKNKNLTLSLAGRCEGIPAYDVIGGNVAYRRPGYVVSVEPGLSYSVGKHTFGLFVPVNFVRNRTQSAADRASQNLQNSVITDESQKVHVQGDAAFADYSISFNYGLRLGKLFSKKTADPNPFETVK
ncbi:MAG TPA: hypothetical protein VGQ59_01420 [Cyclobacteriaceae bacterium]|jgi:hypothetical protein|nr:hypothetical protein [Cyclobacteriaceae bacterium]